MHIRSVNKRKIEFLLHSYVDGSSCRCCCSNNELSKLNFFIDVSHKKNQELESIRKKRIDKEHCTNQKYFLLREYCLRFVRNHV